MNDHSEDTDFTREQLKKLRVIVKGVVLTEHAEPDGKPLVVDVLEAPRFWIRYDRAHGIYRWADRKACEATPYVRERRRAE